MIPVVGLGAGGHARVVMEALRLDGRYEIIGLLDKDPVLKGRFIDQVEVLGGDDHLRELPRRGVRRFFVGVGGTGDGRVHQAVFDAGKHAGLDAVSVVHPRAVASASAVCGEGTVLLAGAIVNPGARLGVNVIVNTGAIVEHDCQIGNHVHLATGARLAGGVEIGDGAHVGIGASVRQGIRIGKNAIIGAGAVVVKDVPECVVVAGVPAKILRATAPG